MAVYEVRNTFGDMHSIGVDDGLQASGLSCLSLLSVAGNIACVSVSRGKSSALPSGTRWKVRRR